MGHQRVARLSSVLRTKGARGNGARLTVSDVTEPTNRRQRRALAAIQRRKGVAPQGEDVR